MRRPSKVPAEKRRTHRLTGVLLLFGLLLVILVVFFQFERVRHKRWLIVVQMVRGYFKVNADQAIYDLTDLPKFPHMFYLCSEGVRPTWKKQTVIFNPRYGNNSSRDWIIIFRSQGFYSWRYGDIVLWDDYELSYDKNTSRLTDSRKDLKFYRCSP